jgi:Cu(I)/Ag(I) efflux system protein CusF
MSGGREPKQEYAMKSKLNLVVAAAGLSLALGSVLAAQDQSQHGAAGTTSGAMAMTSGEVRKVDLDQGKITLKHEAIANLDMPAMTMVFRVAKPELLKDLKAGDKVQFHAESSNGTMVVTYIQAQK